MQVQSTNQTAVAPIRDKIEAYAGELAKLPQLDMPPRHYFVNGMYAREILIPKGTAVLSKIHKHGHISVVIGDITVVSDTEKVRLQGHNTITSGPGTQRAGYAHSDTIWTAIHTTDKTTPEEAEFDVVVATYEEFLAFVKEEVPCLS